MSTDVTLTSLVLNPWDGTFATGDKIALSYADLDYTPSASDPLKSTSGDVFKVYIGGVRIYRSSDQEYASGSGFLEDGDVSGQTLNGQSAAWTATSDNVWTIETASQRILLDKSEVEATSLYGSSGLNISITSGVIIELRRAVQDLKTTAVDFSNASILTEQDLDNSAKNVFHVAQQAVISTENAMLYDSGTDTYKATQPGTSTAKRISNVATPSASTDAANKAYVDGSSNTGIVASSITNVNTVAGEITPTNNIATVAGNTTNINAVAGNNSNITTVATNNTNVTNVGADIANVNTVAGSIANVNTVAGSIANVNTVATNIGTISAKVSKSGDTMTGLLTLSGAPTADNHASTKAYTDSQATALALALG